jgi:hypothetical protein
MLLKSMVQDFEITDCCNSKYCQCYHFENIEKILPMMLASNSNESEEEEMEFVKDSFININTKEGISIEIDWKKFPAIKSKLFSLFYEDVYDSPEISHLYVPFKIDVVENFICNKYDKIDPEVGYNFLNYILVDDWVMIKFLTAKFSEDHPLHIIKPFIDMVDRANSVVGCCC